MSVDPGAPTQSVVEIRNLSRRFGDSDTLSGVTLSIPRGGQRYHDFPDTDIRNGGHFHGVVLEGVVGF